MAEFNSPEQGVTPEVFDRLTTQIQAFKATIPPTVRIVAVTKTLPAWMIRAAYAAGLRDMGESRIQEAVTKQAQLQDLTDINWHFIGHLQSNKTQKALEHFDWIQSVDSLALAKRLNRQAGDRTKRPKICLQIKLWADPNKSGWDQTQLQSDLPQLREIQHLDLCGMMVIAPFGLDPSNLTKLFSSAQKLRQYMADSSQLGPSFTELSMGMSDDYGLAISNGSTMIRPGRRLFGDRA
jgi:PLP dependent protein